MTFTPPPRGLRVLYLRDRLILHDLSFAFRSHPYDRNSLIDAANSVHHRQQSHTETNSLNHFDLPTQPAHTSTSSTPQQNRYLVLPFAPEHAPHAPPSPYEASTPEQAGITPAIDLSSIPVDAAVAFLGLLPLHSAVFAVLATQVRCAGTHPTGPILSVSKIRLVRLGEAWQSKEDKDAATAVIKLLESGSLYYSIDTDLTLAAQRRGQEDENQTFCWSFSLSRRLPQRLRQWAIRTVYGFVGTHIMRFQYDALSSGMEEFSITVISRRSRLRAGTRYITRGVDALGNVANSVETEQIVWREDQKQHFTSFIVIRGSVPVYWRQNNGIAKPSPELDDALVASRRAFARHFDSLKDMYGYVSAVSLVDQQGSEGVLADAFERHFELYLKPFDRQLPPKLVSFDFHTHCAGKEYERGLGLLLDRLRKDISEWGFYLSTETSDKSAKHQKGVFRVNCVDCLDRTNVVQSMIARVALTMQLEEVFRVEFSTKSSKHGPRLFSDSEDRYKHLWGDNADAVSKQYSGTGALKTDFTRTGKRSTTGVIGDGMKSVMRMYYKNFVDEGRQEVIDVLCGNVSIRRPSVSTRSDVARADHIRNGNDLLQRHGSGNSSSSDSKSTSLWYSFESLRINAGGDKQPVFLELHDDVMSVVTPDGISLEFPRKNLVSWSKRDDGKLSDRKATPAKLRLIYKPTYVSPVTASPLDLQFKGGTTARENFLRALLSWSRPHTASLLAKNPVRVRVISSLKTGKHRMSDWGLAPLPDARDADEIIALVLPVGNETRRSWGLAAVPIDVDFSDYVLVGACAAGTKGPSIAVLASKRIVPTVMMVSDATTQKTSSGLGGGAAAIAIQACGTSFCFVSAQANGVADLQAALATLRLGRQSFDVTNQFHHLAVAGILGDIKGHEHGEANKVWAQLPDGSCYQSSRDGLSVLRNSFPTLAYKDMLDISSRRQDEIRSSGDGKVPEYCILEDGVVIGRVGPRLPENIVKRVVVVSNLRAENVIMPRGVEQTTQMNCVVVLYCDLATVDGVATRPTTRPSTCPDWRDTLNLYMMPSDLNEIYESFILGQIVIPMPLGDPVPAGHFVLPVSFARESGGDFDIPCRLAGKLTARLSGNIQVADGDWEIRDGVRNLGVQRTEARSVGSSKTSGRNSLPPIPTYTANESSRGDGVDILTRRPHSTAAQGVDGFQMQARKKGAIEDMNGKLNAARKKGSKQMKFVVNKLSSFLNQPTSTSNTSSIGPYRGGSHSQADTRQGLPTAMKSDFQHSQLRPKSEPSGANTVWPGTSQLKEGYSTQAVNSKPSEAASMNSGLVVVSKHNDADSFGAFLAASDRSNHTKGGVSQRAEDPLLQGLQERQETRPGYAAASAKPPTHFGGMDNLLSGLAQEKGRSESGKRDQKDDDEWGDFESADRPTTVVDRGNSKNSSASLLDL